MHRGGGAGVEPILIRCDFTVGGQWTKGFVVSLSEEGAVLATEEPIQGGQTLGLHVVLPWGTGEIRTRAEVTATKPGRDRRQSARSVRLSFLNLSPADQESIRSYVRRFHELAARLDNVSGKLGDDHHR